MKNLLLAMIFLTSSLNSFAAPECPEGTKYYKAQDQCLTTVEDKMAKATEQAEAQASQAAKTHIAENSTIDKDNSKKGVTGKKAASTIAMTFFTVNALHALKGGLSCTAPSGLIIMGASALAMGNELLMNMLYKKKLKKIREKYKQAVTESALNKEDGKRIYDQASYNQSRSFDALIEQEQALAKNLEMKGNVYIAVTILYAAAVVIAILDKLPCCDGIDEGTCSAAVNQQPQPDNDFQLNQSLEVEELYARINKAGSNPYSVNPKYIIALAKNLFGILVPTAHAQEKDLATGAPTVSKGSSELETSGPDNDESGGGIAKLAGEIGKVAGPTLMAKLSKTVKTLYNSSITRIVLGGVMGVYSGIVAAKNLKEAKNATKRAKELKRVKSKILKGIVVDITGCSADDRTNPQKAICYCFTADGKKNTARVNSNQCKITWGQAANLNATDYNVANQNPLKNPKSCLTKAGKFDPMCSCKKVKSKNSKNSCMTLSQSMNFGKINNMNWAKGIIEKSDSLTNGTLSPADLDTASLMKNAADLRNKADELGKSKIPEKYKKIQAAQLKLDSSIRNTIGDRLPALQKAFSGMLPSAPKSKDEKEEIKKSKKVNKLALINKGRGAKSNGKSNSVENDFDFGIDIDNSSKGSGVVIDGATSDNMEDFDLGKMDISEKKQESLFKIISSRYHKSGYGRLFELESKEVNEGPAKK